MPVADNYSTVTSNYYSSYFYNTSTNYITEELNPSTSTTVFDLSFFIEEKKKMKNLEKMMVFSKLDYNWNGNGAQPFPQPLIYACRNIINELILQPEIFPTAQNSIQFEYEKENGDYLEFEVFENQINMLIMNESGDETEESFH